VNHFREAKVGLEPYTAAGPEAIGALADLGYDVFCDLKLHDIPTTVARAARVAGELGVSYLTAHAAGGVEMLQAGVEGLAEGAVGTAGLLAVTVLTSEAQASATRDLVAQAAVSAGAEALVLTNTLSGIVIDINKRRPVLGAQHGGVSGAALHPVAVRAVYEVRKAMPVVPIVGVGGVACGADAVEMLLAGASAVQVGTAIFAEPRAPWRVLHELRHWCETKNVEKIDELIGVAHES